MLLETPMPPGDPLGGYAATQRMEHIPNWRPAVSIEDGVTRYIHWLQRHPAAVPAWLHQQQGAQSA